jgi:tetratricopeptide (TPR) repeat protein
VQNNLTRLQELPAGGEMGTKRFLAKTKHLRRAKPAYDAYDKAQKSLQKGDVKRAQSLVQRAIRLEPKEAHFYALLGDLQVKKHRNTQALKSYNRATALNANFFYYYLQRGKLEQRLRRSQPAEADFKRSVALLPTADAYYGLGNLARQANRMTEAKQYFAKVAKSPSPLGKAAYGDLVDLDLASNPNKYLALKLGNLPDGRAAIQIQNPTPRAIQNMMITVRFMDANGQARQVNKRISGRLEAGKSTVSALGLGILNQQQLANIKVSISRADIAR